MTHPDGKEASHPETPRSRRGRADSAKSKANPSAQALAAGGYESDDESITAAADDAAWDEETAALPEPVHATGAGGAVVLSDESDDDRDETALPFLYDEENDDGEGDDESGDGDDVDGADGAGDDVEGIDQELADQQALLRRAGEVLASLGREPVAGIDDEDEEDGEFQWADDDDPGEQVTLVDEEWLQRVASHAVRRVTARVGDAPAFEASADPDGIRPPPSRLEFTLLEPALNARVQSPGAPAMRQDHAALEEAAAELDEDEDESELVPLLTEAAYEEAVAEAEAASRAEEVETGAFAPTSDEEPEPAATDESHADSIEQGEYHALMLDDADAAPPPGAFEDFAARGGRIAACPAPIWEDSANPTATRSVVPEPITVTAAEAGAHSGEAATAQTHTILAPEVAPTPEPAVLAEPVAPEVSSEIPEQQPAPAATDAAANPPLGQEFEVTPDFDIAEALAPEPEHHVEAAADAGVPADEFEDAGGDPGDWDDDGGGDEPLGYESAREPALAGRGLRGGGWTIPVLCLGIGLIACCLLIPLADSNRRLAYERQRLARDLESIQTQVAVNDEFLRRVHDDPSLAERLAQRQMKTIRQGTRVLELDRTRRGSSSAADMSPFQLVAVQPPAPLPPYRPLSGTIANLCYRPRSRLYLMGVGLFMMACGLVLGYTPKRG